jgi:uncharacterized membrane protein YfhO
MAEFSETKDRRGIFILLGLCLITSAFLFGNYLLGKKLYLFLDAGTDTIQIGWPYYTFMADSIRDLSLFGFWSFRMGIGMSTFNLGYFLFDLFNWLLMPFNSTLMAYGIVYLMVLKIVLAGLFFFLWVRKFGVSVETAIVGAFLYAFNSYLLIWGQHIIFGTVVAFAPLLFFAVERALRQSKWVLFSIVIALCSVSSFYLFYILSIGTALYILFRVFHTHGYWSIRTWQVFSGFLGMYALGVGLSAILLFPSIASILSSPRVVAHPWAVLFSQMYQPNYWISMLSRVFTDGGIYMSGNTRGIYWDGSLYESPSLYVGLLALMVLPQIVYMADKRFRNALLVLGGLFTAFLCHPYFAFLFEGFNRIAFRWTFLNVLIGLFIMTMVLDDMEKKDLKIHRGLWLGTAAAMIVAYLGVLHWGKHHFSLPHISVFNPDIRNVVLFIALYSLWGLIPWPAGSRFKKMQVLFLLIPLEMAIFHHDVINHRSTIGTHSGYLEAREQYIRSMERVVKQLALEDPDFYRLEKDFSFTWGPNDPVLIRGYRGTTAYTSFQQPSYVRLLMDFNADTPKTPLIIGEIPSERLALKSLLGVRYFLSNQGQGAPTGFVHHQALEDASVPLLSTDDMGSKDFRRGMKTYPLQIYKNPAALPVGWLYTSYMERSDFMELSPSAKDRAVLEAAILDGPIEKAWVLEQITKVEARNDPEDILAATNALRKNALTSIRHQENRIEGEIAADRAGIMCFAIPFDQGWECSLNGIPVRLLRINSGLTGAYIQPGKWKIRLQYRPVGIKVTSVVSLACLMILGAIFWLRRKKQIGRPGVGDIDRGP